MRFIRLIVRRVVRGLGHLDFSILSLNGDSKVPIFLFLSVPFFRSLHFIVSFHYVNLMVFVFLKK